MVAYLMKHRGWRLAESYKWVKDKRPNINLKPGRQLRPGLLGHPAVGDWLVTVIVIVIVSFFPLQNWSNTAALARCRTLAEDAKRVVEFELQLHGSCSAPLGLQALESGAFASLGAVIGGGSWRAGSPGRSWNGGRVRVGGHPLPRKLRADRACGGVRRGGGARRSPGQAWESRGGGKPPVPRAG